jgi:hypothetical protein
MSTRELVLSSQFSVQDPRFHSKYPVLRPKLAVPGAKLALAGNPHVG